MKKLIQLINGLPNRHAGTLLVLGLAGVTGHNWRLWRRDRTQLDQKPREVACPSPAEWPDRPHTSILVAAWNEAEHIEAHIESFRALSYPAKKLILCAGGADDTFARATPYRSAEVTVLEQRPGEGKQRALQRCLPHATGTIIVLSDADCIFSDEAFLRLVEPIVLGRARVVTGISQPRIAQRHNNIVQYQWFTDLAWSSRLPLTVDGVLGRNCAIARDVLDHIGGFASPARTGTDYVLSRLLTRAGYEIWAVPDSRIATDYPDGPQPYLQMWRRWNKNLLIHGLHFGAWKDVRGVTVASLVYGATLTLPLVAPVLGPMAAVTSLLLFSMALLNRIRRIALGARLAGRRLSAGFLARVPLYTLLDMLAVLVAYRDALSPRLRSKW